MMLVSETNFHFHMTRAFGVSAVINRLDIMRQNMFKLVKLNDKKYILICTWKGWKFYDLINSFSSLSDKSSMQI
jgi:hypothetical protein